MTGERKIRANRANAQASTGPKTARGRSHAARNALRHALSLPVYSDPVLSEEVEALAREIIGTDSNPEMQELARRIAEAQIDLRRVRHVRHQILSQALSDPDYESEAMLGKKAALAIRILRRSDLDTFANLFGPCGFEDRNSIMLSGIGAVAGNLRIGTRARTKSMAALDRSPPIIRSIVQEEIGNRLQLVAV